MTQEVHLGPVIEKLRKGVCRRVTTGRPAVVVDIEETERFMASVADILSLVVRARSSAPEAREGEAVRRQRCTRCDRGEVFGMSDDSGFWVEFSSVAGGANEHGMNGWLELVEHWPDGRDVRREYVAKDSPLYAAPSADKLRIAKPLDWRKPTRRDRDEGGRDAAIWIAPGFGGEYAIQSDLENFILWRIDDPYAFDTFSTVKAAKAHAEADWQKTITRKLSTPDTMKGDAK